MYTVIGSFRSRAFRVLWAVEELGLDYEHLPESPRSESVLKHNPSGKIPVLLDDGEAVTDSTAIMTYLADKHGALTFAAGTLNRARQDAWTNQILDDIDAVLWTAARHSFILPEEMRLPAIKDSLKWEYERNLKRITDHRGHPARALRRLGAWGGFRARERNLQDLSQGHACASRVPQADREDGGLKHRAAALQSGKAIPSE
jgi:glutathione S-transferase